MGTIPITYVHCTKLPEAMGASCFVFYLTTFWSRNKIGETYDPDFQATNVKYLSTFKVIRATTNDYVNPKGDELFQP